MGPVTILNNAANLCHCWEKNLIRMVGRARPSIRQCPARRAAALSYALKWENSSIFIMYPRNT